MEKDYISPEIFKKETEFDKKWSKEQNERMKKSAIKLKLVKGDKIK